MSDRAYLQRMSRELADQGRLIEAGWISFRVACDIEDASSVQLEEMRNTFFAGAQYLLSSIINMMDPGHEPTADDLKVMCQIDRELRLFLADYCIAISRQSDLPDDERYGFGGGWNPMPGLTMYEDCSMRYPGDPPYEPLAMMMLRSETILIYRYGIVAIVQPDGTFEASRLD